MENICKECGTDSDAVDELFKEYDKRIAELEAQLSDQSDFAKSADIGLSEYSKLAESKSLAEALKMFVDDDRYQSTADGIGLIHPGEPLLMMALADERRIAELESKLADREAENHKLIEWKVDAEHKNTRLISQKCQLEAQLVEETESRKKWVKKSIELQKKINRLSKESTQ